jgi:hypothetical protein
LLFHFLQPAKANASLGCIDAMIALTTGGLMLLNGVMGMQAANQANQNANGLLGNMDGMGSYPNAAGTSPTPNRNTASLGASGLGQTIKIDPSLLHSGTANDIMGQMEKKFGISRDAFANSVANGEDPRNLFGSAPKNPLSNDDMNKATNSAKGMSEADKANALAATALANAQKELAKKIDASEAQFAVNLGSGSGKGLSAFSLHKPDSELAELETPPTVENLNVSPEVQAALAAKDADDRINGITELSIFQVVHNKYRERYIKMFGFDLNGLPKGVNNADGL